MLRGINEKTRREKEREGEINQKRSNITVAAQMRKVSFGELRVGGRHRSNWPTVAVEG